MKIQEMIDQMTLEEKAAMLQGWTTWTTLGREKMDLPEMFMSDGPHGLRKQEGKGDQMGINASVPATCFPTAATMANSWDPSLGEELGRALGEEAAANSVHLVLGPGLNMKRSPLCGRNFEYFAEDPYLAGKMAAAYIRGIQANGVAACPKHFAVNSQELRRMASDSVLDERTLREIYLTGFEIAVKESHPRTIMSSYNRVNGTYANENGHLLQEILRGEWGFDGMVVTDWGADNDHVEGVRNGSNLVMPAPGPDCAMQLVDAVKNGKLEEKVLDERLAEMLPVILETAEAVKKAPDSYDKDAHHALAKRLAASSIVLLENDGILPLSGETKVALIGDFAKAPRYQGAGSSMVNTTKLDNLYDCLAQAGMTITGYAQGFNRRNPNPEQALIDEAAGVAEAAEKEGAVVLLCVGLDEILESEGLDRAHMELAQGQQKLIRTVCEKAGKVVLVLSGGAPFVIPEYPQIRAIVHGYLGGQAGAGAMADILTGAVNPSGKLNETWPAALADNPSFPYFPAKERTAEYREGLYIGYRYYDTAGVPVRYPFGYGLSYTKFAYSDLKIAGDEVRVTVTNTGSCAGAEVVQVYVGKADAKVFRPRKELKGFAKVFLEAGESAEVCVMLDDKAFRYFNVKTGRFEVEGGRYEIFVGANVSDIRLSSEVTREGTGAPIPYETLPSYESGKIDAVSDEEFKTLLGHEIPDGSWSGTLDENDAICQLYYAKSAPARLVYKIMTGMKNRADAKGIPDLNILFIYNMPFRAIAKMSGGMVSDAMVKDIMMIVNGHFFRGVGRVIADFVKNLSAGKKFVKRLGK